MDQIEEAMLRLFPSTVNNSRRYLSKLIERFRENPTDSKAQELENFGISVDHSDADYAGDDRTPLDYDHIISEDNAEPF